MDQEEKDILDQHALTEMDYDEICKSLGRKPNKLEIGIFGAMWCEHTGYRFSKPLFRFFDDPTSLIEKSAGEESPR